MTLLQAGLPISYPEMPEVIAEQSALLQTVIWMGGIMVVALLTAVVILWRSRDEHAKYIRESDKENILIIKALTDNQSILVVDVAKIKDLMSAISPKIDTNQSILGKIDDKINDIKN